MRAKAAFAKDSSALYSLMDSSETRAILQNIEEAYEILSHPEKRTNYDKQHGFITLDQGWHSSQKIISKANPAPIESSVAMDVNEQSEDALIAPRTDFTPNPTAKGARSGLGSIPSSQTDVFTVRPQPSTKPSADWTSSGSQNSSFQSTGFVPKRLSDRLNQDDLQSEIQNQSDWTGAYLKRIREYRRVTIEELSEWTRISKAYLTSIEEEQFQKLPSAVYVRGFVIQIAKVLKIPHEAVASAYMSRYYQAKPK